MVDEQVDEEDQRLLVWVEVRGTMGTEGVVGAKAEMGWPSYPWGSERRGTAVSQIRGR